MNDHNFDNFDLEAARIAQSIIQDTNAQKSKEVENLITKTLGVLEENGVYACMLYVFSRPGKGKENEIAKIIRKRLFDWNEKLGLIISSDTPDTPDKALKFVANDICSDLDTLFLVKELWERTLIYARYGAKAKAKVS
jgi:hypothetical protein